MTEKEKMIAGKLYNPKDGEIQKDFYKARLLLHKINTLSIVDKEERDKAIFQLINNAKKSIYIEPPFYCDYGYNIIAGENLYINFNLNNSPMALPRGFQTYLPLRGGRNCLFAIPGGAKYKISVFGPEAKMKPAKYPYGLPRG